MKGRDSRRAKKGGTEGEIKENTNTDKMIAKAPDYKVINLLQHGFHYLQ